MEIHPSALKHGVTVEDIEHAVRNAIAIDLVDDNLQLYIGPSQRGELLEVLVVLRADDQEELAIHAMAMREKYQRLLPGDRP